MPTVVFNEGRFNGGHYLNKAALYQQTILVTCASWQFITLYS